MAVLVVIEGIVVMVVMVIMVVRIIRIVTIVRIVRQLSGGIFRINICLIPISGN